MRPRPGSTLFPYTTLFRSVSALIELGFELGDFLGELRDHRAGIRPVETDACGAPRNLGGAQQRGEGERHSVEDTVGSTAGVPLGCLMRLPGLVLCRDRSDFDIAEHMWMASFHLVGDR